MSGHTPVTVLTGRSCTLADRVPAQDGTHNSELASFQCYMDDMILHCEREKARLEAECDELSRLLSKPWPGDSAVVCMATKPSPRLDTCRRGRGQPASSKPPSLTQGGASHQGPQRKGGNAGESSCPAVGRGDGESESSTAAAACTSDDEALLTDVLARARRAWKQPADRSSPLAKPSKGVKAPSSSSLSSSFDVPRLEDVALPEAGDQRRKSYSPGVPRMFTSTSAGVPSRSPAAHKPQGRVSSKPPTGLKKSTAPSNRATLSPGEQRRASSGGEKSSQSVRRFHGDTTTSGSEPGEAVAVERGGDPDAQAFSLHRDGPNLKLPGRYCKLLADYNTLVGQLSSQPPASVDDAKTRFLSRFGPVIVDRCSEAGSAGVADAGILTTEDPENVTSSCDRPALDGNHVISHWWLPGNLRFGHTCSVQVDPATRLRRSAVLYSHRDELVRAVSLEQDLQISLLKEEIEKQSMLLLLPVLEDTDPKNHTFVSLARACSWLIDTDKGNLPSVLSLADHRGSP